MSKTVAIVLTVTLVVSTIIYVVVIFELYKNESWIFQPYEAQVPDNACQPLISVREMDPEEKDARDAAINASL